MGRKKKNKPSVGEAFKSSAEISAKSLNITILWDTLQNIKDTRHVDVRCDKCNTIMTRPTKNIVKGSFICFGCVHSRYKEILYSFGYKYIRPIGNQKLMCQCNTCNNEVICNVATLNRGTSPRCTQCIEINYKVAANEIGFEYICKIGTKSKIKCLKDGFELIVANSALLSKAISCRECQIESYREALSAKGCKYIEMYLTEKYGKTRVLYEGSDGSKLEATSGNILHGKFKPSELGTWDQNHEVYCIVVNFNNYKYLKIGTANNSFNRFKHLKLCVDSSEFFILSKFNNRYDADNLEKQLHKKYAEFRIDKEIPKQFTKAIKYVKYADGSKNKVFEGVTEWFCGDILEDLLSNFNIR